MESFAEDSGLLYHFSCTIFQCETSVFSDTHQMCMDSKVLNPSALCKLVRITLCWFSWHTVLSSSEVSLLEWHTAPTNTLTDEQEEQ